MKAITAEKGARTDDQKTGGEFSMKAEVSPETLEALAKISKAAGGTGAIHLTVARICDNCEDDDKEAFPYGVYDATGKYWKDLCNECFDLLGCSTLQHNRRMNNCSHATGEVIHQGHYGSKIDFDVIRCTYGCNDVFVNVIDARTKLPIERLPTYIAPWATNAPARGNAYYWRWDGLNHSTPPIAPNDDDDLTPTPPPAKL